MAKNPQARPPINPARGKFTPISLGLYDDQIAFIEKQTGNSFADKLRSAVDSAINSNCANEAIKYAVGCGAATAYLKLWLNNDFDYIKDMFPDAPESVFPRGDNHGND